MYFFTITKFLLQLSNCLKLIYVLFAYKQKDYFSEIFVDYNLKKFRKYSRNASQKKIHLLVTKVVNVKRSAVGMLEKCLKEQCPVARNFYLTD